jgi:hypothetical protein
MNKWENYVLEINKILKELKNYDIHETYTYYPHNKGATEIDIKNIENSIGYKLDNDYKEFLKVANGWKFYSQFVSLFSTDDLISESLLNVRSNELLEGILEYIQYEKKDLLAISIDEMNIDLFVIVVSGVDKGNVIWYAGYEVERYCSFEEYIIDVIRLLKLSLERDKLELI